jgi:hypothetical protein
MHRSCAEAKLFRNFQDALAIAQCPLCAAFNFAVDFRPPKSLPLSHGAFEPKMNPLPNHTSLKLGKRAADLKHQPSGRGRSIDRLLFQEQIDTTGL